MDNQLLYTKYFLGLSTKYTLATDGCAVDCLGFCLSKSITQMNQDLKDRDCFALYNGEKCIINWAKLTTAFPEKIKKCIRVTTYDNDKVLSIIKRSGFCIVCVDYDGNSKTVGDHFVVFTGNSKLQDPLGGKEKPTSTYPLAKGYVDLELFENSVELNMTQDQSNALKILEAYRLEKGHGNLEGTVNAIIGSDRDIVKVIEEKLNVLKSNCLFLSELIKSEDWPIEKVSKITDYQKLDTICQSLNESAKKFIENLTTEKNTNFTQYRNKNDDFNLLNQNFEEYKKTHQESIPIKFNIINFIKNLLKK